MNDLRDRYYSSEKERIKNYIDASIRNAGITKKDETTDILKKGASVYRMSARANESLGEKRKYVSITAADRAIYREAGRTGGIGGKTKRFETEYKTNKDISIANADTVVNSVLDKYGDIKIKDLGKRYVGKNPFTNRSLKSKTIRQIYEDELGGSLREYESNIRIRNKDFANLSKTDRKLVRNSNIRIANAKSFLNRAMHKYLYDDVDGKIFNSLKQKGYDAIVDAEDYGRLAQYPVIFLKPSDSLTKSASAKYTRIKH